RGRRQRQVAAAPAVPAVPAVDLAIRAGALPGDAGDLQPQGDLAGRARLDLGASGRPELTRPLLAPIKGRITVLAIKPGQLPLDRRKTGTKRRYQVRAGLTDDDDSGT